MATIEEAVRQMLVNNAGTLPSARISYGYRPQSDALPAVTFTLSGATATTIGSSPIRQVSATINAIADLTIDAATMLDAVEAALVTGTYDGIVISSCIIDTREVNDPVIGFSDEQEPATATLRATIYYET